MTFLMLFAFGVERAHLLLEPLDLLADREELGEGGEGLLAQRLAAVREAVLRQVADGGPAGHRDLARVGAFPGG